MKHHLNRREFLAASAAAGAGLLSAGRSEAAEFKTTLHKALIGVPTEETFKSWHAAGFEGMESRAWDKSPQEAAELGRMAKKLGIRIHSVMAADAEFNSNNLGTVARDIAMMKTALRAAQGYGADAVLLCPCPIRPLPIPTPEPWEFSIEFAEKTGHLKRVVAGDNSKYRAYIEAHDRATDTSRDAIRKLIPVAEKTSVVIAIENVWDNFWVKPALFKHFIASFDNPWVRAYFDIGNHVKYAPPEQWIRTLGKLIIKCHVKDFKLNPDGRGGRFVDILDGSVDWPLVRKELDAIDYNGWMTIEGSGGLSLEEQNRRLDLILAGKSC